MAKQKARIDQREANRLNNLFKGKTVITRQGGEGRVTRVTRGGIQVYFATSKTTRPYPLREAFNTGELRFKESALQGEMMRSLRGTARVGGLTPPATEQSAGEPRVSAVNVPDNVRLVCFFKNADDDKYLSHMKRVGLEGFEESLEEGFKRDPFVALRETECYLGCSLELLLKSFEEFAQQIFKECSSQEWGWSEPKSDMLQGDLPHRSVRCDNRDGKRSFFVQTIYADKGMHECTLIQVDFTDTRKGFSNLRTIRGQVFGPTETTMRDFDAVFNAAGGAIRTDSPSKAPRPKTITPTVARVRAATTTAVGQIANATSAKQPKPIRVNEFLVRKSYGTHRANGHSLDPVRATVIVLPKTGGDPRPVEFDEYWCPKCRKYFMTEGTYIRLKRQGYICCKVVEEKDLGTKKAGEGVYGKLASESILHMYGYTVNQQDNLSEAERRTIISFVIENRIQSTQDIAHLLEWLISQREGNPRMSVAVSRWRADLSYVKHYRKPTRKVRVDSIYAKV